jgi:hypothetical protein
VYAVWENFHLCPYLMYGFHSINVHETCIWVTTFLNNLPNLMEIQQFSGRYWVTTRLKDGQSVHIKRCFASYRTFHNELLLYPKLNSDSEMPNYLIHLHSLLQRDFLSFRLYEIQSYIAQTKFSWLRIWSRQSAV